MSMSRTRGALALQDGGQQTATPLAFGCAQAPAEDPTKAVYAKEVPEDPTQAARHPNPFSAGPRPTQASLRAAGIESIKIQ